MADLLSVVPVAAVDFYRVRRSGGTPRKVTAAATVPRLTSVTGHGFIDLDVAEEATPDPTSGLGRLFLAVTDDPDVAETFGWTIKLEGETATKTVSVTSAQVSAALAANPAQTVTVDGQTYPRLWLTDLTNFAGPSGASGGSSGSADLTNYFTKSETGTQITNAVTAHKQEADPHPQYALDSDLTGKANTSDLTAHSTATNNPHSVTKSQVGLGSVDNTADTAKPVSTAQQAALDAKAPLASPAFTGTPTGITKAHVGLGNVDNTSDAAKQTANDTRYFPKPDETGASIGKVVAVAGTNPVTYQLVTPSGGGGATLTQSATKTANYTAAGNEIAPLDTSAGTFTLTGPSSGAPFGGRWRAGTAAPTIAAPSGYTIAGQASIPMGLAPGASSGELVVWQAFGTDYQPVGGFKPQTAIDTRAGRALNLARVRGSALVRQMAAAPPHAPLLMDTPPVVTQGTTVTSGLTASYTTDRVRWTGPLADSPTIAGAMQPRGISNGADGTQNFRAEAAEMWFDFDGRYLDISLRANTSLRYRLWVDGEAATADLVLLPSGTGANAFLKLDFGTTRRTNPRRITIEFEDTSTVISVLALRCAPTDYLATSPRGQRVMLVGDSQARGQGPTRWSFSYARTVGRMLGVQDFWHIVQSGPGTGLVAGSAPVGPYGPRAPYDVIPYLRAGDVLIIQGSVNDFAQAGNVGPALEAYVNQIRAAVPDIGIIVTGLAYIGTPDSDRQTINTELKTKAAALGLPFVDMFDPVVFGGTGRSTSPTGDGPADWGRIADYTHFTDDGAWMYGRRVASLIMAAVGIPAGDLKVNKKTVGLGNVPDLAAADVLAQLQPPLASGHYFFPVSPAAATQNGSLGNGTMRVAPWLVTRQMSITRICAEITTAGEAGSKFRPVIYADNGQGYPGALLVDGGQLAGDSATVQEATISQVLPPGLYWIGGVVQAAPTTQPFLRAVAAQSLPALVTAGTTLPAAGIVEIGVAAFSVAGTPPATFPATINPTSAAPRVFCRTA